MKKNIILKNIILALQGAVVGTGAILPGVSGGVLCVAFGIYEPMMELLSHPRKAFKKYYKMFIPFLIGWAAGFTLLARAVELLFSTSAPVALMLFFGLICGTLPQLFKDSQESDTKANWSPFVLSLALSFVLFSVLENNVVSNINVSFFSFVICGLVWGLSLIIPGLSSSSILIFLGLYEPMTSGIADLNFAVILPLLLGLAITVISLARVVQSLFEKNYSLISKLILGIVISSSLKIVPSDFGDSLTFLLSLVCFIIGFIIAIYMDKAQNKSKSI